MTCSRIPALPAAASAIALVVGLAAGLAGSDTYAGSSNEPLARLRLTTIDAAAEARRLEREGFDVLRATVGTDSLEIVATDLERRRLEAAGYRIDLIELGRPFREIALERAAAGGPPAGYPDLTTVLSEMSSAEAAYPAIARVVNLTLEYGTPQTYEGRDLFALKISDNVFADEDEPSVLLVGNHHARELVTPVIALHAIEQLTTQYGVDGSLTALVDGYEIWVAPTWNPDGLEHVFSVENLWRKNRRVFPTGVGVDINRNYPFGWTTACSGSTTVSSNTYKGPAAASESETQTMLAFTQDRAFAKVMDYHSSGQETLWGYACLTHPLATYLQNEATSISQASGYGNDIRPPSADGEHYQWQLGARGAHAFLVETATQFQPTYATALAEAAQVFEGFRFFAEAAIPLSGRVTDAVDNAPVVASLAFPLVSYLNGETHSNEARFGRYHVFAPPGSLMIEFSAAGYLSQTHVVQIVNGAASNLDVQLLRGCAVAAECDDGDPCTVDICDPGDFACSNEAPPVPPEVAGLLLQPAAPGSPLTQLTWTPEPAADSYNVYRSPSAQPWNGSCLDSGIPDLFLVDDGTVPASGQTAFHLVTGRTCSGESSLGPGRSKPLPCP